MLAKQINNAVISCVQVTLTSLFTALFIKHKLSKPKFYPFYFNTQVIAAKLFWGVKNVS